MRPRSRLLLFAVLGLTGLAPVALLAGETLPPGPPWHTTWKAAKRSALRTGRPVFAYFTKRY